MGIIAGCLFLQAGLLSLTLVVEDLFSDCEYCSCNQNGDHCWLLVPALVKVDNSDIPQWINSQGRNTRKVLQYPVSFMNLIKVVSGKC